MCQCFAIFIKHNVECQQKCGWWKMCSLCWRRDLQIGCDFVKLSAFLTFLQWCNAALHVLWSVAAGEVQHCPVCISRAAESVRVVGGGLSSTEVGLTSSKLAGIHCQEGWLGLLCICTTGHHHHESYKAGTALNTGWKSVSNSYSVSNLLHFLSHSLVRSFISVRLTDMKKGEVSVQTSSACQDFCPELTEISWMCVGASVFAQISVGKLQFSV